MNADRFSFNCWQHGRVVKTIRLALHDQVSCASFWCKHCASFYTARFFLSELLAERNVCGFCPRNLLMYLHDVHPAIFQ